MWIALMLLPLSQVPCPSDREVAVDLPRWTRALNAAKPAEYDGLLAQLKLPPLTGFQELPQSVSAAVTTAHAGDRHGPDRLVVADFDGGSAFHHYRVQLLRPLRPGVFCALGSELSQELQLTRTSPCPAGDGEPDTFLTLNFRFTPLTDPVRESVEVVLEESQSSCRGMQGRETSHRFWEAPDNQLRQVLVLSEGDYRVAAEATHTREWFTLTVRPPRVAEQFTQRCVTPEDERQDGGETCTTERTRFTPGYLADSPDARGSPAAR